MGRTKTVSFAKLALSKPEASPSNATVLSKPMDPMEASSSHASVLSKPVDPLEASPSNALALSKPMDPMEASSSNALVLFKPMDSSMDLLEVSPSSELVLSLSEPDETAVFRLTNKSTGPVAIKMMSPPLPCYGVMPKSKTLQGGETAEIEVRGLRDRTVICETPLQVQAIQLDSNRTLSSAEWKSLTRSLPWYAIKKYTLNVKVQEVAQEELKRKDEESTPSANCAELERQGNLLSIKDEELSQQHGLPLDSLGADANLDLNLDHDVKVKEVASGHEVLQQKDEGSIPSTNCAELEDQGNLLTSKDEDELFQTEGPLTLEEATKNQKPGDSMMTRSRLFAGVFVLVLVTVMIIDALNQDP